MNIPGHSCAPQTSVRACIRNIDSPRAFNKLADMLFRHLEGLLNYCRIKVPFGVVEAINGNIKALLRRGRGYKDLRYLLLKAQRMNALRTEFVVMRKAA